jgi:hypothetical protein
MRTEKFNYKWEGESIGSNTETATGASGEHGARRRAQLAQLEDAQGKGPGADAR